MPNLRAHIDIAHRAAERLAHPTLDANMGCFLFGSTSPDIRVITRRGREVYHFAELDFEALGSGIEGLFSAHPGLKRTGEHNEQTVAFVCGYLTHLIVDESWIVDMYRPYFGNREVFGDSAKGNVYDRALQLELDRQSTRPPDAADLLRQPAGGRHRGGLHSDGNAQRLARLGRVKPERAASRGSGCASWRGGSRGATSPIRRTRWRTSSCAAFPTGWPDCTTTCPRRAWTSTGSARSTRW